MKLAAIADIHGNCLALEAVLADISALGISEVINLGDHLSGPLEARRTADLLIARGFPSIRGDQDRVLVELGAPGASRRIDHRQLEPRHLDWLASLPPTLRHRDEIFSAVRQCRGAGRGHIDGARRGVADRSSVFLRVIVIGHQRCRAS